MNRAFIFVLLVMIIIGAWVFKTHAPIVLEPVQTQVPLSAASKTAAASPSVTQENTPAAQTPFQKIAQTLKDQDRRKFVILDEILKSRNDNDQRLDTELNELSPEMKQAMIQYYAVIPQEARNERGTIVFLLARTMSSPHDVGFLKDVLLEKPCMSLSDCSKSATDSSEEDKHLDGINETTASYPQLTGLQQSAIQYASAVSANPPNQALADQLLEMFRTTASRSPNARVAGQAQKILRKIGKE